MRSFILLLVLSSLLTSTQAQSKYWVRFTDKGDINRFQPEDILSPRALANRTKQGITLDASDYPVHGEYIQQLRKLDVEPIRTSKWLNGISAELRPAQRALIAELPFVASIRKVATSSGVTERADIMDEDCPEIEDTDTHWRQLSMVGLDDLHRAGYTGKGVLIAVFDNGYRGVDTLRAFSHLFAEGRILATRDYVDGDEDVYGPCVHCRHGTNVFSILAAKLPGRLMGTAPDAEYILFRTENDYSETHQEEDNWIAAAEFADSMGAQVFTTSLGYFDFDEGEGDYTYDDLDGNTSLITIAADMAGDKGILVLNSAGNSSTRGVVTPADGDKVIAVGAVDQCEEYASFSSQGPTADGRVKPDIAAMGQSTYVILPDGRVVRGNGTSFSCPVASGLTACLLQASPQSSRNEVYDALIQSADRYGNPDKYYGHGIPNGRVALALLNQKVLTEQTYEWPFNPSDLLLYPNPAQGVFYLSVHPEVIRNRPETVFEIQILNMQGAIVYETTWENLQVNVPFYLKGQLQPGYYVVRVSDGLGTYLKKLILAP
jgi:serine protease AprX